MTVVGIDVSKGKSMVAAMKPGGELVTTPYEVKHSDIELSRFAYSPPGWNSSCVVNGT